MNILDLAAFGVAFLIAALISPLVILIYSKNNWVDDPSKGNHKKIVHLKTVPRGGGIPIFIALLISSLFFLPIDPPLLGILIGSFILTLVGFFDDIYNLNPYFRLLTGALASLCAIIAGISLMFVTNPFGVEGSILSFESLTLSFGLFGQTIELSVISSILTIVWIVWTMNMVNWSKGVDGQMPGFVAIAAIIIGLLSLRFIGDETQWQVWQLALITAGSFCGLLVWNAYPQKIMPGYGAGSLAGFLLAVLSILSGAKVATLILVLSIPMLDAFYTILRRLYRGRSPVWGDRGHLHHRFIDIGWSKKQVSYFYWVSTAILGLITLQLNSTQKVYSFITLAFLVAGVIFWLRMLREKKLKS